MLRAAATVDAVIHQGMTGIQHLLDGDFAMAAFAIGDVVPREDHVIDDVLGIGPGPEQVIAFKK